MDYVHGWNVLRLRLPPKSQPCDVYKLPSTNEVSQMSDKSLYERLGGYDVVVVAVDEILPRLMKDSQLERF